MYHNIPMELRELTQWVCWRYEIIGGRRTKVPYSTNGQHKANVHNPATWGTFNDAVSQSMGPTMDGIGFMLTEHDPYTGIDIDDKLDNPASEEERARHIAILEHFQSYTERSVGGRGYHIIIRGKIAGGRDRGHVGVYSTARYLTFSGDVVRNAPIADYQESLTNMVSQMPDNGFADELWDIEGILDDLEVHEMAMGAANGEKYLALCQCTSNEGEGNAKVLGSYTALGYESQSHADLALLSIFAFYTRDNAQVKRLFRYSGLGRRAKAMQNDVYLNRTLRLIRNKEATPTDFEAARLSAQAIVAAGTHGSPELDADAAYIEAMGGDAGPTLQDLGLAPSPPAAPPQPTPAPVANVPAPAPTHGAYTLPPGLVGELAQYFHATAVRPLQEAALAAAIGVVAGIVGRSYNISGTGLNQYILFLGKTGTGKEAMAKGISKMMSTVRMSVPMVDEFMGPSAFASGQGLIRTLDQHPCFVSILGEFGLTLQALSDPRAPAAMTILRKVLLDLYGKSGWEDVLRSTAYSDQEKNTKMVHAPNVSLLAESTPETFYDGLDAGDIADGLIPRFHIIEYKGKRPVRNRNAGMAPPQQLAQRFADLCALAVTTRSNNTCAAVQLSPEALALLDQFDSECDEHMNTAHSQGETQLWNRAHLKALKLSGLLAVGVNPHAPTVDAAIAQWAIDFTQQGTQQVLSRFFKGDVGNGEAKQQSDLRKCVEDYFALDRKSLENYKCKVELQKAGLVPYGYLVMRLNRVASFYRDRSGAARSLKLLLETMVQAEMLGAVAPLEAMNKFKAKQQLFYLGQCW